MQCTVICLVFFSVHSTQRSTQHSALQLRTRSHHTSTSDVENFSPEIGVPTSARVNNNNAYGTLQLTSGTRDASKLTNVSLQYSHGEGNVVLIFSSIQLYIILFEQDYLAQ